MEERRSWAMETHNIALTALNKIEAHADECNKRQARIDKTTDEIKNSMEAQAKKSDEQHEQLRTDIKKVNTYIAMAIGGLIVVTRLIEYWVQYHQMVDVAAKAGGHP